MQRHHRTIIVDKKKLIAQIKKNKEEHIKEYNKAVDAYRIEAAKQLTQLRERLEEGELTLKLDLVTPVNIEDQYDSLVNMFEWDKSKTVELNTSEYKEYIENKTDFAVRASLSNTAYLMQSQ